VRRVSALILGDGSLGIGPARKPLRLHLPRVGGYGLRFLCLGRGIGLRLLLRQLTRMHHDKAPFLLGDPSLAVLDLDLANDAWAMPLATHVVFGPPGFFHQERQGGGLLAPRFQLLAHRTGAWHEGHHAEPLLQAETQGPSTLGFPIRHDALDALQAEVEVLLYGERGLCTVAGISIP
jgi:hypothetical protein